MASLSNKTRGINSNAQKFKKTEKEVSNAYLKEQNSLKTRSIRLETWLMIDHLE